jgi:uncharacterized membrane protein
MQDRPRTTQFRRVEWAAAVGALAILVCAFVAPWQITVLAGWDVAALVFIVWVWWDVWRLTAAETRVLAKREDDFEVSAHIMLVVAALVSLIGVAFALLKASGETGLGRGLITAVAVASVTVSWVAVHVVFTLRYAKLYFDENNGLGGGINFHEDPAMPDYRDFAYVSFTLGMTYQVSDTDISARSIRRVVLRHAAISYVFGVSVIAVIVNVVAGFLTK